MAASPFSIENKVAIVTGGGVGIGKSIAIEFARAGADVVIASRKIENLEPVTAEIQKMGRRSFCVALDVRQEDQVKNLVERTVKEMGRLDVMVNNAGASFRAKVEDISANGWNTVVGINLNGTFFGCKWAGRKMMEQPGGGSIINISSIAGVYGSTMMSHYGAAKAAVITFTRELGMAWGRKGVRVNCIAPGGIETPLQSAFMELPEGANLKDLRAIMTPMGNSTPEEIANIVAFVASDDCRYMTASVVSVDGGLTA